ncbi:MAG: spore coat U domain-containing protein [Acetobacteraceae bacterium]|jgi:spore coat protein U-like protein
MTSTISTGAVGLNKADVPGSIRAKNQPLTVCKERPNMIPRDAEAIHTNEMTMLNMNPGLHSGICSARIGWARRSRMRSAIIGLAAILSWMSAEPIAQAGTATGTLPVSMTILASCTIGATSMAFTSQLGAGLVSTAATATGSISVTCTNQAPYAIGLDNGANYSTTRRMVFASTNYLPYNLYTNAGMTTPWSTATDSATCTTSTDCYTGTGNGSAQSINVYGQIPTVASSPPPGAYSDTVNITIYF